MPVITKLPERLFARRLRIGGKSQLVDQLPRYYSALFDVREAQLGDSGQGRFLAAIAKERPTVINSRNLVSAIAELTDTPLVICWDGIDPGMKRIFAKEGIPYIKDADNALLPFLGAAISSEAPAPAPAPLSPYAQRILFNLLDGTWNQCTAGEIAQAIGKSNSSVTKYLSEIEVIAPGLVSTVGKNRVLSIPANVTRAAVLDAFDPFISSPVSQVHRIAAPATLEQLIQSDSRLAGESALAALTDLAQNPGELVVALDATGVGKLAEAMGDAWQPAPWYEDAPLVVEEWRYRPGSAKGRGASELDCVDLPSLYASVRDKQDDDVRFADAVEQIKEQACQ